MKKYLYLLFTIISISSCSNSEFTETSYSDKKLKLTIDSLEINLNHELIHDYPYSSQYFDGNLQYFIGYNISYHKLDVFNITQRNYEYSIQLNHDGPNKVDAPWDFYIHNLDSIFFFSKSSELILLNKYGKIALNIDLSKSIGRNDQYETIGYKAHPIGFKLKYDRTNNWLFFNSYSFKHLPNEEEYYRTPFISYLDFASNKINSIPVEFSKIYLNKSNFLGEYFEPNVTFLGDLIIYSFPADPNIYTFNLSNKKHKSFGAMSQKTSNSVNLMDSKDYHEIQKRMDHLIENPYFFNIVPDSYRNLYYRIHSDGISQKSNEIDKITMADKPEILTVFDKEFKIIQELELPLRTYNANSIFVTKEGLMIPYSHFQNPNLDEGKLKFHIFKFSN